jgi:hypothetical protein
MKTILLISLAALGAITITQSLNGPQLPLKPAKDELPTSIVKSRKLGEQTFNPTLACTRNLPAGMPAGVYSSYEYIDENGETQITKHCIKCNTGVYSSHPGEAVKSCSFCGEKE